MQVLSRLLNHLNNSQRRSIFVQFHNKVYFSLKSVSFKVKIKLISPHTWIFFARKLNNMMNKIHEINIK